VFVTDRRARIALPPGDLDPATGRARLSYRRAAELFEQATVGCPGGPWTLHQLRHSALTHAAQAGANTATLLAYPATPRSRRWPATPAPPEALARRQRRDPPRRRH
jgi:integrase/recombinase XerC/integrase/recombinase XerD